MARYLKRIAIAMYSLGGLVLSYLVIASLHYRIPIDITIRETKAFWPLIGCLVLGIMVGGIGEHLDEVASLTPNHKRR